jgi:hypothetical protein
MSSTVSCRVSQVYSWAKNYNRRHENQESGDYSQDIFSVHSLSSFLVFLVHVTLLPSPIQSAGLRLEPSEIPLDFGSIALRRRGLRDFLRLV